MKKLCCALCACLLFFALTGCAQNAELNGTSATMEIYIDRAHLLKLDSAAAQEGNDFLEISVTVKNITEIDIEYSAIYFFLDIGESDMIDTIIGYPENADTMLRGGTLKPGETASGTLIYEKPIDAETSLVYYGNGYSENATGVVAVEYKANL